MTKLKEKLETEDIKEMEKQFKEEFKEEFIPEEDEKNNEIKDKDYLLSLEEDPRLKYIDFNKEYKNMDIGGKYLRVGDEVIDGTLALNMNPLMIISNEEVITRNLKKLNIDVLTKHKFRVVTDQTKPPRAKHSGMIKINLAEGRIPFSGIIPNKKEVEFIN